MGSEQGNAAPLDLVDGLERFGIQELVNEKPWRVARGTLRREVERSRG